LPWVFVGVDEEDVVSLHGGISVHGVGILNGWESELDIECSLAVIDPVVSVDGKRSLWIHHIWSLEEAEFGAELPGPWSFVFGGINGSVGTIVFNIVGIGIQIQNHWTGNLSNSSDWEHVEVGVLEEIADVGS